MKKQFILFIALPVLVLAFNSCKKSSNSTPVATVTSSMTLTANGVIVNFNTCAAGTVTVNGAVQTVIVGGNLTNGQQGVATFQVSILADPSTLKAGQTFNMETSFGQTSNGAYLAYFPTATGDYVSQPANPSGTVAITAVTSTTVSGTFSGKLFATTDFSGSNVIYTITNGSFTYTHN